MPVFFALLAHKTTSPVLEHLFLRKPLVFMSSQKQWQFTNQKTAKITHKTDLIITKNEVSKAENHDVTKVILFYKDK